MKSFGLFGNNIVASISPKIHQLIWQCLSIDGYEYNLYDQVMVPAREQLQRLNGANITIPFKEQIHVDCLSDAAAAIGAINTVYWQNGQLCGANTDWIGIDKMLFAETDLSQVLIIGSGGAAKAVYYALIMRGVADENIVVAYRNNRMNNTLQHIPLAEVNQKLNTFSAIFQTTPADTVNMRLLAQSVWYYDLRYTVTLAQQRAKNGLEMLIWQAIAAEELWLERDLLDDKQLFLYIKEQIEC
ncbi:shikimate dehydrogenase family protein [Culicoidibacter larvae]|uniref:Shikimate dehydrogenase substrate binding N-terminal domain-containing protein n=1 Tax=Culicoidibacter larvae TaxID=2579976 RepID=A0A5R8QCQ1_9FIRM|nr:hypothetical protein [Culicoidibacter larvae]TLG74282.1 hypothetical protein FEZ08_06135 [Culicoidibacter larvae]